MRNAGLKPVDQFPIGGNEIAISPNGRVAAIVDNRGEGSGHAKTRVGFVHIRSGVSQVTTMEHGAAASSQWETQTVGREPWYRLGPLLTMMSLSQELMCRRVRFWRPRREFGSA